MLQPTTTQIILQFFSSIDIFLLLVVRMLGFIVIIPVLAGSNIPMNAKVGFSILMAYLLFATNKVVDISYTNSVLGYGMLMVEEFFVGFTIGFTVFCFFSVMYFVGQLIDMQIGFSMVSVFDPVSQIQVPIAGNLLFMIMGILLIEMGGLHAFIQVLFYSYELLPIGSAFILGNEHSATTLLAILATYFVIGLQVSMPIVGATLIIDIALGLLVKAVPQMNIFVVGLPLKLLLGLMVFYIIFPIFYDVYDNLFSQAMENIIKLVKGMA